VAVAPNVVRFGAFELDLRAGELRKLGIKLGLPEQSIKILAMLVAQPGEVVLREEIRKGLWPQGTIVEFDHSINAAVNRLRRALGDEAGTPGHIETLPRRGYRFLVPLQWAEPASPLPATPLSAAAETGGESGRSPLAAGLVPALSPVETLPVPPGHRQRASLRWAVGGAFALLVFAVALLWVGTRQPAATVTGAARPFIPSIAVLPLQNLARLGLAPSVNALAAYLQGNYYLNRFTEEDTRKAQQYFQQTIDADPGFAAAYVGMALSHSGLFQGSREDAAIARRAVEKALELDPTLSDAWMTLGKIKLDSWDWSGMEEEYRKAIELNPNNAAAHQELGAFLDAMGRLDEGLKESQIAQQLDPNQDQLSSALYYRREFDRSIEIQLIMLRKDPDDVALHHNLYLNYEAKGMYKDAAQHLEKTWTLAGFPDVAVKLNVGFAGSGYTGAMREYANELEHLHATRRIFMPVNLAGVYAILGDKDRAFYWLEQAYKHSPGSGIRLWDMKLYPALEPLHSDPRFKDLLRRVGLPP
jgi:DNA-binding winged helix-turn-helix (wHTH) protein/tetratricopeptide (TPR) repeat protein